MSNRIKGPAPRGSKAGADAAFARAIACHQGGDLAAALAGYDATLKHGPRRTDALNNRGIVLLQLGRSANALESFARALAVDPAHADALANRGIALYQLGRFDEAVDSFDRALAHAPAHAVARQYRGEALFGCAMMQWQRGEKGLALERVDEAIRLGVAHGAAFNLRGMALHALGRRDAALADFDRAIALDPQVAQPELNRAEALESADRLAEAVESWERALALAPDLGWIEGRLTFLRMKLCDWRAHDRAAAIMSRPEVLTHSSAATFALIALADDPAQHRRAAAAYLAAKWPDPAPALPAWPRRDRIRIGYVSSDFHAHATMYLMADMLAAHDRDRFELTAFSYGPDHSDTWQQRAEAAVDRFVDVRDRTDAEIAALARALEIDIAVDLKGLTGDARTGIFAARAAPIQVNFLGYPGTMPAPFMDYLIADPVLIPPWERDACAERILYLPESYQPNGWPDREPRATVTRAQAGLPEGRFVFCSFNQSYKITPVVFASWMRILADVPDSVLWLWVEHASAGTNLRAAAEVHGIAPDRLILADSLSHAGHLARLPLADLFLDTAPYGAHTTASDALRTGLVGLTCPGHSFASRVAASLFTATGLPELICSNTAEYERRAIALAGSPEARNALRQRLAAHRETMPLFDPERFARHLERAYEAIYERAQNGLAPEDIRIEALP